MRFVETREIIVVLLTAFKNFHVGMHSNIYELIWFKVGMMMDTVALHILILV